MLEEMLKFVLKSSINGTLEFDLGFSNAFCSALLQNDPSDPLSNSTAGEIPIGFSPVVRHLYCIRTRPPVGVVVCLEVANSMVNPYEGVPSYPLYKHIASALWESLNSGSFCPNYNKISMLNGDNFLKHKETEWMNLIIDLGSEMLQVFKTLSLELHVQEEPFFSQLKDGHKSVEGRCALGEYDRIEPGTLMIFNKCLVLEISDVRRYMSFSDMLESENLQSIFPGVENIEEGLEILKSMYREEEETADSVLALSFSNVALQPYISLARILSGLGYEGLQALLGLTHTVATVVDALPPPRSVLLSSFMLPYKPEGKVTKITHGARALAKHSHRSSNKYWGSLDGSDSNKNRLATNTILHLIAYSCWLNIHIVAPHGVVFEIRVADGYGARWSRGGTKFIGFLEPYMEDGYLKGWKH